MKEPKYRGLGGLNGLLGVETSIQLAANWQHRHAS
jgi:hypothetical protein